MTPASVDYDILRLIDTQGPRSAGNLIATFSTIREQSAAFMQKAPETNAALSVLEAAGTIEFVGGRWQRKP